MPDKKLIAKGTTADVYEWDDGRVLKLFNTHQSRDGVQYEADIGRMVAKSGISAPQVYEILEENGLWGIVYERIVGSQLSDLIRPWNAKRFGREMARLHATLFSRHLLELPSQRSRLTARVSTSPLLNGSERDGVLALLEGLPEGSILCHGDFHPANLMQTGQGLVIIDWTDATQGHPTADIARTVLILEELNDTIDLILPQVIGEGPKPDWLKQLAKPMLAYTLRSLLKGYREEIERLVPEAKTLIARWMPVLAAARLHEGQYINPPSLPDMAQAQQRMVDRMLNIARKG